MSVPYHNPLPLWTMPSDDFNEWRAQNDLPLLFAFLLEKLPHFQEWLDLHKIDVGFFCRVVPSGAIFFGSEKRMLVEEPGENGTSLFYRRRNVTREQLEQLSKEQGRPVPSFKEFTPYFHWAKQTLGRERFFRLDEYNDSRIDNFIYNRWAFHNVPEKSRASLFGDFEVLKLGGVTLNDKIYFGGRNLDFTDMDHLVIKDKWHGPGTVEINYASCRRLTFSDTMLHHFELRNCDLDRFTCNNSELQNFLFRECSGKRTVFSGSMLSEVEFVKCYLFPEFTHCTLQNLLFKPRSDHMPSAVSDQYRRLRIAAQEAGNRHEASMYYYLERKYERKALFSPYLDHALMFSVKGYNGHFSDVALQWWKGELTVPAALKRALDVFLFHLRIWTRPKLLPKALGFKLRYFSSLFEETVWGYGERPFRIFMSAFCFIAFYASIYYFFSAGMSPALAEKDHFVNSVYLSIITFTTVGYGDLLPNTPQMKLVCATEALIGCFTMGLVVAGFSNKSRY